MLRYQFPFALSMFHDVFNSNIIDALNFIHFNISECIKVCA